MRLLPDGNADPSFGVGGVVTIDTNPLDDDTFDDVLVQPDGRIVASGGLIVRYLDDGSLDTSFSGDGKLGPIGGVFNGMIAETIVLQGDGKLLVGGTYSGSQMSIGRLNADGSTDTGFGSNGRVNTSFGMTGAWVRSLLVLPDGKILAGGESGADLAIAQYSPDGVLDANFGTGGSVTFDLSPGASDRVLELIRQSDGRLVAAGLIQPQDVLGSMGLVRFNADGSHDATFGTTNGRTVLNVVEGRYFIPGQASGAGDDIIVSGVLGDYGTPVDFAVARFDADGAPVDSYGDGGVAGAAFTGPGSNRASDVLVLPDGRFVVAGSTWGPFNTSDFMLARYLPDGAPDATFGEGGTVLTDFGRSEFSNVLAVQDDGKLVVAGRFVDRDGRFTLAMARYNEDGTLDTGFGDEGRVIADFGANEFFASVAIQHDGKILAAGWVSRRTTTNDQDLIVVRYDPDGTLDGAFGTGGITAIDFGESERGTALLLQPDGKIVLAGEALLRLPSYPSASVAARLQADGSLDTTFGDGGKVIVEFTSGSEDEGFSRLARYADGRILAFGNAGLARFLPGGTLDPSFDGDGKLTPSLADAGFTLVTDAILQPDGKILIGGTERSAAVSRFVVARLNADGSRDSMFSDDGAATASFAAGRATLSAMTLTTTGQVLTVGYVGDLEENTDFAVARFQNDLFIESTDADDVIFADVLHVRDTLGPRVRVWVNADPQQAPPTHEVPISSFDALHLDAGGGNDRVTLETSGMFPRTSVSGGEGADQFTVTGSGTAAGVTFEGGVGNDSLAVDTVYSPATVVFPVQFTGGDGVDSLVINGTDGKDAYVFRTSNAFAAGNYAITTDTLSTLRVDAGAGDDDVTIDPDSHFPPVTIAGGAGEDTVDVTPGRTTAERMIRFQFDGDADDDVLIVRGGQLFMSAIPRHGYDGGAGTDRFRFVGTNERDAVRLLINSGTPFVEVDGNRIDLVSVEAESYDTGAGDDWVQVGSHSMPADVETGDGNDRLTYIGGTQEPITFHLGGDPDDRDTLELFRGDFTFDKDLGEAAPNLTLLTGTAAQVTFNVSQSFAKLDVADGTVARLAAGGEKTLSLLDLAIAPKGTLDLADHEMHIPAMLDGWKALLVAIEDWVGRARNSNAGMWKGTGITSSVAAANPLTGLAVWANDQVDAPFVPITVKYTYNGDATLDGRVNSDDYFLIDRGFLAQPAKPLYRDGDFNFDDRINSDDYFLIDSAFLGQGSPGSATAASVAMPDVEVVGQRRRVRVEPVERAFDVVRAVRRVGTRR